MAFRGQTHDRSLRPRARTRPAAATRGVRPWVATGLTAALLAGGFTRQRGTLEDDAGITHERRQAGGSPHDRGRGRHARTPSDIPARGWKDIVLRVYRNISDDRILAIAAGVAYYLILAIFPALAALVAIYGLFADPASIQSVVTSLSSVLPSSVVDIVEGQLHALASQPRTSLGATFAVSLGISLWSANSGLKAIFDALNIVYHEGEKRSFLKLNAESLAFTVAALVSGIIGLALVAVLPPAVDYLGGELGIGGPLALVLKIGRWPLLLVAVALAIAVVYRYGPSREKPRWRWVTWGSSAAAILWLAASLLFSWYSANFASYNKTYGSLAAAIVFMTWVWISVIAVLLGAELDAEMEHQTVRDTTTGQPRPLGARGAFVADTVGRAQE